MVRILNLAVLLGSAITSVQAHPEAELRSRARPEGCGAEAPVGFDSVAAAFGQFEAAARAANNGTAELIEKRAVITIDTYFHVVARSTALSGGYVPASQLTQQIAVMNKHYSASNFQFKLVATDYTVNANWASRANGYDATMKKALRKGTYNDLNVYFQYDVSGYLGICTFPTTAASGSTAFYADGCNVLYSSTPGGTEAPYNLGGTTTHEVGHWMGLYHVFQGGCSGSGDGIADTPPQSTLTAGCPTGQDSCSGGGVDSIHNYMDYSDDSCYTNFTPNQITRMANMWATYRAAF